jgi:signal transduction histidine kinase/ligand-binding sensor domain-containing protein
MTGQIKKWVGLLLILLAYNAFGQDYNFVHLTSDMGLSQGNVSSITRDNKGFLWIGTENGLNKFDGYSFTTYHHIPNDPFSLSNDWVFRVKVDPQNRLWVTTRNGFHLYDRVNDRFIRYKFQGEAAYLNDLFIYDFLFDSTSSAWLYTNTGLIKYNLSTNKIETQLDNFVDSQLLKGLDVKVLNFDSKGNLWIVGNGGSFKVDFQQKKVIKVLLHDLKGKVVQIATSDFHEDKKGNFWIATAGKGVFILDKEFRTTYWLNTKNSNLSNDDLNFIEADTDNNIWIGTNNGLNVLAAKNVKVNDFAFINLSHKYYDTKSLLSDIVSTFYQEKEGRIMIGSRFGGVDYYDKQIKQFNHLFLQPGSSESLSHNNSTSIVENKNGEVFIGTDGGGIDVFSKDRKTVTPFSKYVTFGQLTNKKVLALTIDSKGRLFVGMWGGGIDVFDFKSRIKKHFKKGNGITDLTTDNIFSLLADKHDNVWVGTFQSGINRIDPSFKKIIRFTNVKTRDNNINFSVNRFYEDKRGNIWMAIDPEGIYKFDYLTSKIEAFLSLQETQKTLGSISILSLYEDSKGRFWVGTRGRGLYLYDRIKNKLIALNIKNKIVNDDVFGILEDEFSDIWVSTNNGIFKIIVKGNPGKLTFITKNFDVSDGLQANQFNLWASFMSTNGELFFGGVNGINYFKPRDIVYNKRKPEVVFTGLSVFNILMRPNTKDSPLKTDIAESKTIVLNSEQSLFSIKFVAMNFTQARKNKYKCKLEGFETNWRYLGSAREVTYTNLDPGTYILKVLASNNDGLWNDKPATLTIVVLPPWWEETWFRLLMVLLLVLLVVFVFRLRMRRLRKYNAELEEKVKLRTEEITMQSANLETINNELTKSNATKNRLFSIIAHDLRSPFSGLMGLSNYLKDYYQELDDQQRQEIIAKLDNSSKNLYDLLSNLLLWSMTQKDELKLYPEPVNLLLVIEHVIKVLKGNIDEKHIILDNDISDITIIADNNQIQAIVRNLLSNAIKYSTDGGLISISCRDTAEDMVEIKIVDQGVGMSEEIKKHLFDSFQIQSQPGTNNEKGTGLGLTIVYDFVTLHKGSIQVVSKPGLGTTFVILLPKQLTQNT